MITLRKLSLLICLPIYLYIHTWSANIRLYYEPNKNHYLPHLAQLCHTPGAPLNWRPGDAHWTVQEPEPVAGVPKFKGTLRGFGPLVGFHMVFTWFISFLLKRLLKLLFSTWFCCWILWDVESWTHTFSCFKCTISLEVWGEICVLVMSMLHRIFSTALGNIIYCFWQH